MRALFMTIALCAGLIASPKALAQVEAPIKDLKQLKGGDLRKAFAGQTMVGTYKNVRDLSGTSRFTETFNTDGTTAYREGRVRDIGQWVSTLDQVCFKYSGPLAGGTSCFNVFQSGNCYYSYAPQLVKNGVPLDSNYWQAKTRIKGEISTCDDLVS